MTREQIVDRVLLAAIAAGILLVPWLAFFVAPSFEGREGFTAPLAWKLFFFHVPVALAGFAAFGLALYHSLAYLVRPHLGRDRAAHAAVEVGVVYGLITLVTGMIWGEAEWGVPWRWEDAKLVLVLVMVLIYAGYLLLRREQPDPDRRARVSAVYAVAGFATVPLAWFAQRIWQSNHPTVFGNEASNTGVVTPGVLPVFLVSLVFFLVLFLFLYRWRRRLLERAHEREADRRSPA